jgi:hypothetical protein
VPEFTRKIDHVELGQRVEEVRGLHQAPRLLPDRLDQRRVAVPDAGDAPAGGEVDELPTLDVPDPGAAPLDQRHGLALDDRQEVRRLPFSDRVELHDRPPARRGPRAWCPTAL